jgi:large subunit ribosomal protein L9
MPVEVLLMADIKDVGAEGEVVRVADGFARNYLLPRKLAAPVTDGTRRQLARMQKERESRQRAAFERARVLATAIEKNSYTILVKVGSEDKMFGAVTTGHLTTSLKEHGIEVDKHMIALAEPLRELGVFDVKVRLHAQVEANMKVWIVEE